ncbi:TPA: hypothetical protein GRI66_05490 [Vibrio parahaemolyticus]|uniref:Putative acetyltransferase n=4 Tax=Vibrio parahaemolyticus TaxID=670 RepID=A0A7M1VU41_VIBPH|nr:hypothetical protein [Vibrio parahaemolyticus]MBE4487707.1 hypothetical protein [Vibrio parahaemolyticus]MBE4492333.1 hypothetical protein [Vibrio parahaemolyticus]MBE4501314.1 hypothetical protein [Vibrio parahaemolyticus]MBE4506292.1 hypothetical protein [Vibrio parahaemolyticus]
MFEYIFKLILLIKSKLCAFYYPIKIGNKSRLFGSISVDKRASVVIGENSRLYGLKVTGKGTITIGNNVEMRDLYVHIGEGATIVVKDDVFIGKDCKFLIYKKLIISDRVLISPEVMIIDNNHVINKKVIKTSGLVCSEITVGEDSWIGAKSILGYGSSTENNVMLGAMSFLNSYAIRDSMYLGVPAKRKKGLNYE